jgi:Bacterial membrane protein YfhO
MDLAADRAALAAQEALPRSRFVWREAWLAVVPLLPFVIFAPALAGRILLAPDDGYLYYLPIHELTAQIWRTGHLPSWNPYQLSGAPLMATQAGAFYPLSALFLLFPAVYANNLFIVLNLAIGALGACLLARRLTNDTAAAVVAGLAFGSSGFLYGHIAHQAILAGAVWIPWAIYGYDLLMERRTAPRFLLAALPLAMSALTAHEQMFFLGVLVVAVYALATPALAESPHRKPLRAFLLTLSCAAAIELVLPRSAWVLAFFMIFFGLLVIVSVKAAVASWARLRRSGEMRRTTYLLPAVIVLGGALAAVQLLPTASVLGQTIRSAPGIGAATSFSFSPSHLILLIFPFLFGNSYAVAPFHTLYRGQWNLTELAGYPGLSVLVLAVIGAPRIKRDPRALALGLAALLAFFLMLGRSTGIGALMSFVPGYGQLRAWGRYAVVVDLALAIFAAYGVAHLRSTTRLGQRIAARRAWITVATAVVLGLVVPALPGVRHFVVGGTPHLLAVVIPLTAAAAAAGCIVLFSRSARAALAVCCLVVAADGALSFGAFFEWRHSPTPAAAQTLYADEAPPPWGAVAKHSGGITRYLFVGKESEAMFPYFPQVTDAKSIRSASGYEPLLSHRYADAMGGMVDTGWIHRPGQFLGRHSWLLDVLRISTVLAPASQAPVSRPSWFDTESVRGNLVRYTYTPRLPAAFLVGKVEPVTTNDALKIAVAGTTFDPGRAALVEDACGLCRTMDAGGFAGRVTSTRRTSSSITLQLDATRPAMLVVSESWFPGWSASVDGKPARAMRTDAVVLGVPVAAGRHEVELRYRAPGFRLGATVSSAAFLSVLIAPALVYVRRRRRARRGTSLEV